MKIPLVRPLFNAAWTVAGLLNPVTLAASPARRKVAALLLGTGAVGGVGGGSYYYVNRGEPDSAFVSAEDGKTPPGKKIRGPVQSIPIEPEDDSSPLGPPPASAFSGGRFRASDDTDTDTDNGADGNAQPSAFGKPRIVAMHDGAIRRANGEQDNDPREAGAAGLQRISEDDPPSDDNDMSGASDDNDTDERHAPPRGGYAAVGPDENGNNGGAPPPLTRRGAPLSLSPPPDLAPAPSKFPPAHKPTASPPAARSPRGNFGDARLATQDPPPVAATVTHPPHATSPVPGAKQLEGLQAPSIALEKIAPAEIQVGKPVTLQIKIRNTGRVVAHQVVVHDHVPAGTRLVETAPQASETPEGALEWRFATLQPGEETLVSMQVVPEIEGDIGSVAQVSFQAQASGRSKSTKPQVSLKQTGPAKVMIGENLTLTITVSNTGTGPATGLFLEASIPEGFSFPSGNELEYEVGVLRPGETKTLQLPLKAVKPGAYQHVVAASNDTNVSVTDTLDIEVTAPQLEVAIDGPRVRYLDRQATYTVSVANGGTAAASDVELAAILPKGLKFISANNSGQYDARNHSVFWSLERLPAGGHGDVQIIVVPNEIGEKKLRVEGRANLGLEHVHEHAVQVEALSELQFSVADTADPIEEGSDTGYEIRVVNKGSKAATNVQLVIEFPAELRPLGGDGPTRVTVSGQQLTIEPLARLSPNNQALYKIQAQGVRTGDPRIRVQLLSDESPNPVLKEESTRVYADK